MGKRIKRDYNSRLECILEDAAISINMFLKRVLGVYDKEIMRAELTHTDLMKMFPNLKRTSFDAIMDDPSCIYTGEVVAVRDCKLNIVPYINTQKNFLETDEFNSIMSNDWNEDTTTWNKEKNKVKHAVKYDLNDLTTYELTVLMELYTKTGQWHDYEVVRKTLIGREDSGRANKKSKQLALKRSMKKINDDEY